MILKGSQRGGAAQLAAHLMNDRDNDHVTLHQSRGFIADTLPEALDEAHAISKATKCKQYLFSLSLNPPQHQYADIDAFEHAADRAEEALGLTDLPRAIVIHEKEGRRHAHVVWSRIDVTELKAVNLPHFKTKLAALSKELYLEHGWELPDGHKTNGWRNPLNFTLAEWQQARRLDLDPREIKQIFHQCWQRSDGLKAYSAALAEHGYFLAQGDRRGFVAVDLSGEIFSVARWSGVKAKDVRGRLGEPDNLPTVAAVKEQLRQRLTDRLRALSRESNAEQKQEMVPLLANRAHMIHAHRRERLMLREKQDARWNTEQKDRNNRLSTGLAGLWDSITGKAAELRRQNEREAYRCHLRDKQQRERLFIAQMKERKELQRELVGVRNKHRSQRQAVREHLAGIITGRPGSARRERTAARQGKWRKAGMSLGR